MFGTNDPNQMVAGLGVAFLLLAGLWRFVGWVREALKNRILGTPSSNEGWRPRKLRRFAVIVQLHKNQGRGSASTVAVRWAPITI